MNLRRHCQQLLAITDPVAKARAVTALDRNAPIDAEEQIAPIDGIPGRGERPPLVPHTSIKTGSLATPRGHAALVHSIVHIEKNAIDLALDICWRFAGMPEAFYRDWLQVAFEEAYHFTLLREHLLTLGFDYGDFPAHDGLWSMAERTQGDILARVALVPRTLEARGLDASPAVKTKLVSIGDHRAGEILDIILRDEIGHVAIGNRWYGWLCAQRGLDPVATYAELTVKYEAPKLKKPFNLDARRAAGFSDAELTALQSE
ncbi:MAG: ferritin-like domain-containing protein [Hylemonella sp.]|nr:ferritin-like domain-containing protein [Hylemonella sp.]MDP1935807.1 ferritin-like domain-containing protein [Hylemonella sp.]